MPAWASHTPADHCSLAADVTPLPQLATLLGVSHPKALIRTEFTCFMAQPFMQLHARWMKVGGRGSGLAWGGGLSAGALAAVTSSA
jgi:hypothetical protein